MTRVGDLGEDAIIRRLTRIIGPPPRGWLGIGDDAAVIPGDRRDMVVTTDALVEGTHFRPGWFRPEDLGWKALAVNLSDLAAMLATPRAVVVSLVLPADTEVGWVEALYRGMMRLARVTSTAVVGGNLTRGETCSITVTAFGSVRRGGAALRTGAQPGDAVFVTGYPGLAAVGRLALVAGVDNGSRWVRAGKRRFLRPEPRCAPAGALAGLRPTALIDVSDGLARDLARLSLPGCAPVVDTTRLPVPAGLARAATGVGGDAVDLALNGGEDYELVFTLGRRAAASMRANGELAGVPVHEIGVMEPRRRGIYLKSGGKVIPGGYDHFGRGTSVR